MKGGMRKGGAVATRGPSRRQSKTAAQKGRPIKGRKLKFKM